MGSLFSVLDSECGKGNGNEYPCTCGTSDINNRNNSLLFCMLEGDTHHGKCKVWGTGVLGEQSFLKVSWQDLLRINNSQLKAIKRSLGRGRRVRHANMEGESILSKSSEEETLLTCLRKNKEVTMLEYSEQERERERESDGS